MAGNTTIGNLNVKVTASAQQFTAIMNDMAAQAQMTGQKMGQAAVGFNQLAESGEHVHHMSARMVMGIQHAGVAVGEGGLAGGMHAAIHAATHLALHMENMQAAIAPLIVGGIAISLFAEHWKKSGEEMEKAAEKANGVAEALEKLAEAQKKAAEARKNAAIKTPEKLLEAADEKFGEKADLRARAKKIEADLAAQGAIITQKKQGTGIFGMEDYYTRDQKAQIEQAKKVSEALEKDLDKTNREIAEKDKEGFELRRRARDAYEKESDQAAIDARNEEKDAIAKAQKEETEKEKQWLEKRAALVKSVQSGTAGGRVQNIVDEAKKRRDEIVAMFGDKTPEGQRLLAQLGAGAFSELSGTQHERTASALDAGSSAAFDAVANAGQGVDKTQEDILKEARKQLAALGLVEDAARNPNHHVVKF